MPTSASWIPLRWPSAWVDPALLGLLEGTPFNCLAMEWSPALAPVAAQAAGSPNTAADIPQPGTSTEGPPPPATSEQADEESAARARGQQK